MEQAPLRINCDVHGSNCVSATVCGHLVKNNGQPLGFIENSSESDDLQAWCFACEFLFLSEQDRTDVFRRFCNYAIVCCECYQNIRLRHAVSI